MCSSRIQSELVDCSGMFQKMMLLRIFLFFMYYKWVSTSPYDLLPNLDTCGVFTEQKIIGGSETALGDHPWATLLLYKYSNNKNGTNCGGVLINAKYVLTAAHCLRRFPKEWKLIGVVLGEHNIATKIDCHGSICAPEILTIGIEEEIVHENYNVNNINQHNDIALLRLKHSVNYSDYIKPICLPISSELKHKDFSGNRLFAIGWGTTENAKPSNVKLQVLLPIVNITACTSIYSSVNIQLHETGQLCAGGEKGRDSCSGDSGEPLMTVYKDVNKRAINWYVIGLVSFGAEECGLKHWPGVYTKVPKYIDWIIEKIRP